MRRSDAGSWLMRVVLENKGENRGGKKERGGGSSHRAFRRGGKEINRVRSQKKRGKAEHPDDSVKKGKRQLFFIRFSWLAADKKGERKKEEGGGGEVNSRSSPLAWKGEG